MTQTHARARELGGDLVQRAGSDRPFGQERIHSGSIKIVDHDLMSPRHHPATQVTAHPTETDHRYPHQCSIRRHIGTCVLILAGPRAPPLQTCEPREMKELIYQRSFLPAADQFASRTAIIDGNYRATYRQHADRTLQLTRALGERLEVTRSDRFAVLALNGHGYLELWHAAFMGAGVINPLNLRLAPKELAYILRDFWHRGDLRRRLLRPCWPRRASRRGATIRSGKSC